MSTGLKRNVAVEAAAEFVVNLQMNKKAFLLAE
jgi:hypothetical protein